jgi:hypothetical protein
MSRRRTCSGFCSSSPSSCCWSASSPAARPCELDQRRKGTREGDLLTAPLGAGGEGRRSSSTPCCEPLRWRPSGRARLTPRRRKPVPVTKQVTAQTPSSVLSSALPAKGTRQGLYLWHWHLEASPRCPKTAWRCSQLASLAGTIVNGAAAPCRSCGSLPNVDTESSQVAGRARSKPRRSVATRLWQQGNSQLAGRERARPRAPSIATRSGLRSHAGSAGCGRRSLGGTAAGG